MQSRLGAWQQSTSSPFKAEIYFFLFFSPLADLFLYMPRESYISIAFLDPSPVLLLFFPSWVIVLSLSLFPLCLSRNKGWTYGCSIRPLQLTWARNIKFNSSALMTSPLFQLYEKQALKEYASCTFTWSAWYRQSSSLKIQLLHNYLLYMHPASLSLHTARTHLLQFTYQCHSTYAFRYLFSGQALLLKADIKTKSHQPPPI